MVSTDLIITINDLVENPTARVPICLVLDVSPSMSVHHKGDAASAMEALNEGVVAFFKAIEDDEMARYAADIAIVTFSDTAEGIVDFGPVGTPPPQLVVRGGGTSIGTAVKLALDALDHRKTQYQRTGVDYYQPWLVLMTDGAPTDSTHVTVAPIVREFVERKKLSVFPIGIGSEADLSTLAQFTPRKPLRLHGLKFAEFFEWLSRSVAATSRSTVGEDVKLDLDGLNSWATL